jgi:hypothetical protein
MHRVLLPTVVLSLASASLPVHAAQAFNDQGSSSTSPCAATPVRYAPLHGIAGAPRNLPWIVAKPKSAHIVGFLFFIPPGATGQDALMHVNGEGPNGNTDKVLWYIAHGQVARTLIITGKNLSSSGTMRQTFSGTSNGYPSILDMPTPGCWKLMIQSGKVKGNVTLQVPP